MDINTDKLIFEIYKELFRRMNELYFSDKEKYDSFGKMNLYINGFCYGEKSPLSWFCCVDGSFRDFLEEKPMYPYFFKRYSDKEIAKRYFRHFYTFEKPRKNCCFELTGNIEAHFDDGSCLLIFCDESKVKLIAFQILGHSKKIRNCNSIELPRAEFEKMLQDSRDFFLSERKKHSLNSSLYGK